MAPQPIYDPEDGITCLNDEIGDGVHWPGFWLALAFGLMIAAWAWDRLLSLLRIPRRDATPAARWQRWT